MQVILVQCSPRLMGSEAIKVKCFCWRKRLKEGWETWKTMKEVVAQDLTEPMLAYSMVQDII
jgi:hypothetical protein